MINTGQTLTPWNTDTIFMKTIAVMTQWRVKESSEGLFWMALGGTLQPVYETDSCADAFRRTRLFVVSCEPFLSIKAGDWQLSPEIDLYKNITVIVWALK